MKIEQQYQKLIELQIEINDRLKDLNFEKVKDLILFLAKSESFQKLKKKDNQMIILDCFCSVWIEEKKQLEPLGVQEDIFYGVNSLKDLERKYLLVKYTALRIENHVPEVYIEQAIDEIIKEKISGIAIEKIVVFETSEREKNIVEIAAWLKEKNQILTAMSLLQSGLKVFEQNHEMLLSLADCWMQGEQWSQAYECLMQMKNPTEEEQKLLEELKKVI